jgi:hypothetical protein
MPLKPKYVGPERGAVISPIELELEREQRLNTAEHKPLRASAADRSPPFRGVVRPAFRPGLAMAIAFRRCGPVSRLRQHFGVVARSRDGVVARSHDRDTDLEPGLLTGSPAGRPAGSRVGARRPSVGWVARSGDRATTRETELQHRETELQRGDLRRSELRTRRRALPLQSIPIFKDPLARTMIAGPPGNTL